jgi:hypothetical protein
LLAVAVLGPMLVAVVVLAVLEQLLDFPFRLQLPIQLLLVPADLGQHLMEILELKVPVQFSIRYTLKEVALEHIIQVAELVVLVVEQVILRHQEELLTLQHHKEAMVVQNQAPVKLLSIFVVEAAAQEVLAVAFLHQQA